MLDKTAGDTEEAPRVEHRAALERGRELARVRQRRYISKLKGVSDGEPKWIVYGLKDPRKDAIFYIGCSKNPERRVTKHRTDNVHAAPTIAEIESSGGICELVELDSFSDQKAALEREAELIRTTAGLVNQVVLPGEPSAHTLRYRERKANKEAVRTRGDRTDIQHFGTDPDTGERLEAFRHIDAAKDTPKFVAAVPDPDATTSQELNIARPPRRFPVRSKGKWGMLPDWVRGDIWTREQEFDVSFKRYDGLGNYVRQAEANGTTLARAVEQYAYLETALRTDFLSGIELVCGMFAVAPMALATAMAQKHPPPPPPSRSALLGEHPASTDGSGRGCICNFGICCRSSQ